jgi:hypothetical protein
VCCQPLVAPKIPKPPKVRNVAREQAKMRTFLGHRDYRLVLPNIREGWGD